MEKRDKAIKTSFTYLSSHLDKLKELSKKTYVPMSAIIRKALDEYFKKYKNYEDTTKK
jgi:metal-responsive CopG/Arc/MetJ family transcriptional regulator